MRAGKLVTMKPDGTDEKVIVKDGTVIDYEWSPDSQWICYSRMDGSFASELFIIPAGGATSGRPGPQRDPLCHVQRRRDLEPDGPATGVSQPAAPQFDQCLCAVAAEAGRARHDRGGQGDRLGRHPSARPPAVDDGRFRVCDLQRRQPDRLPRHGQRPVGRRRPTAASVQRITTGGLRPMHIQWSRLFSSQLYFRDKFGNIRRASTVNAGARGADVGHHSLPRPR